MRVATPNHSIVNRTVVFVTSIMADRAVLLSGSLASILPVRAGVWFRPACIEAQHGELGVAKAAIQRCITIDPEWKLRVINSPALEAVW